MEAGARPPLNGKYPIPSHKMLTKHIEGWKGFLGLAMSSPGPIAL